jgi:hypothetical protein
MGNLQPVNVVKILPGQTLSDAMPTRSTWPPLTLMIVFLLLLITAVILASLLFPLPHVIHKYIIRGLQVLNAPYVYWVVRVALGLVVLLTVSAFSFLLWFYILFNLYIITDSIWELYQHESRVEPLEGEAKKELLLSRFKAERNFYLHIFTISLIMYLFPFQIFKFVEEN